MANKLALGKLVCLMVGETQKQSRDLDIDNHSTIVVNQSRLNLMLSGIKNILNQNNKQ